MVEAEEAERFRTNAMTRERGMRDRDTTPTKAGKSRQMRGWEEDNLTTKDGLGRRSTNPDGMERAFRETDRKVREGEAERAKRSRTILPAAGSPDAPGQGKVIPREPSRGRQPKTSKVSKKKQNEVAATEGTSKYGGRADRVPQNRTSGTGIGERFEPNTPENDAEYKRKYGQAAKAGTKAEVGQKRSKDSLKEDDPTNRVGGGLRTTSNIGGIATPVTTSSPKAIAEIGATGKTPEEAQANYDKKITDARLGGKTYQARRTKLRSVSKGKTVATPLSTKVASSMESKRKEKELKRAAIINEKNPDANVTVDTEKVVHNATNVAGTFEGHVTSVAHALEVEPQHVVSWLQKKSPNQPLHEAAYALYREVGRWNKSKSGVDRLKSDEFPEGGRPNKKARVLENGRLTKKYTTSDNAFDSVVADLRAHNDTESAKTGRKRSTEARTGNDVIKAHITMSPDGHTTRPATNQELELGAKLNEKAGEHGIAALHRSAKRDKPISISGKPQIDSGFNPPSRSATDKLRGGSVRSKSTQPKFQEIGSPQERRPHIDDVQSALKAGKISKRDASAYAEISDTSPRKEPVVDSPRPRPAEIWDEKR